MANIKWFFRTTVALMILIPTAIAYSIFVVVTIGLPMSIETGLYKLSGGRAGCDCSQLDLLGEYDYE